MAGDITGAATIAAFVTGFDRAQAPAALTALAETAFVDTLGVMLAGAREPAAQRAAAMVMAQGAQPAATVIGTRARTSAALAALANGTATQALDYDLSFMIGQSTAALIPALLAAAETSNANAAQLIDAFITGVEVCGALAACLPTLSSEGGWHGAGVLGTLAATAAVARLNGLTETDIANAIGIAASMASSVSANFGTMTKPLHAGLAARNAIDAVALTQNGFTGSDAALDGRAGFFACFGRGIEWDAKPLQTLGTQWRMQDPGYKIKPFACGGLLHCSIEAALEMRDAHAPRADDIKSITIGISHHALGRAIDAYPHSEDTSRFTLRYLVAYSMIHGTPMAEAFTEAGYDDAAVRDLWTRSRCVLDDAFAKLTGSGYSPGHVTIEMADGTRLENTVLRPTGSPEKPMSAERLSEKFMASAVPGIGEARARELHAGLSGLSQKSDLDWLWPLLAADA